METKKILLRNVCKFNAENINMNELPDKLFYLDTGSITKNIINNIHVLNTQRDKIPSRARKKVKNNTIIYSTVRPNQNHYGIIKNPEKNLVVSTGFATIDIISEEIEPLFLYYKLTMKEITNYLQTIAENSVSAYPSITPDNIGDIELEIPKDKTMQEKIGGILYQLDLKIELNNKINFELEAMVKTLYDYWFVQFDFPNEEGKPYKSGGGAMEWNEESKREIPVGWELKELSSLIKVTKTGDWGVDESIEKYTKKVKCFRGADINGLNGLEECLPPIRYIHEQNEDKLLEIHDLIIEISGGSPTQSTGRIAFITEGVYKRFEVPIICSNFCKAISLINEKYLYNFYYMWESLYNAGIFFNYEGKTTGIKNFQFDAFVNSYKFVKPPIELVEKFYYLVDKIQEKKQKCLEENQELSKLRDWLLPMLMNGQVSIE